MAKIGVGGKTQNTQETGFSSMDPGSAGYIGQAQDAGRAAGNAGWGPLLGGAAAYGSGLQSGGAVGNAALSGDAGATQQLMNPYQQQVIDANNRQWQKIDAQGQNQVDGAATQANAFGGSRHGVASGVMQSNNDVAQAGQTAGLLSAGYNGAMDRASQLSQLGLAGANLNSNLGMSGVGNPDLWRLKMMQQGWLGPSGQIQQKFGQQQGSNVDAGFSLFGGGGS